MLKYCSDRYCSKIQKIYVKAINFYLLVLTFVSDWFVTRKMIEKLDNILFSNVDVVFGDVGNDTGLNSTNLNIVNLDDDNFDDSNPKSINHVRLMAWYGGS